MGALTSSLLSEISLQFTEHNSTFDTLIQQHIIGYFRHIDEILIIYVSKIPHIFTIPSFIYICVLFHLRMALVGAKTCSVLVLLIMFTYNKYAVMDGFYFMSNWLINTMGSSL